MFIPTIVYLTCAGGAGGFHDEGSKRRNHFNGSSSEGSGPAPQFTSLYVRLVLSEGKVMIKNRLNKNRSTERPFEDLFKAAN